MINELRGSKNDTQGVPNYRFYEYSSKSPSQVVKLECQKGVLEDERDEPPKTYEKQYMMLSK